MDNPNSRQILLEKYINNTCTRGELSQLLVMVEQDPGNEELKQALHAHWRKVGLTTTDEIAQWDEKFILMMAIAKEEEKVRESLTPVRSINWIKRIAIAAAIIIAISTIAYLVIPTKEGALASVPTNQQDVKAPESNRAMITLADGSKVYLDSAANGQLFTQHDIKVTKTADGKIVYEGAPLTTDHSPLTFNTLSNPRGSKVIDIALSDGSHVWLNANSSITYPIAFTGNQRKISITGEAYFEIAKSVTASGAKQPFIVNANNKGEIEVLGTHFNVNAYDNEDDIRTTLLEGSIRFTETGSPLTTHNSQILSPGEQAVLTRNSQLITRNSEDLAAITAWKDNRFYFASDDIYTIARQVERWYDVDIDVQPGFTTHFTGIISRSVNASEVFRMLKQTGTMQVKIEGKKIEISK